jgi:hypothetical protein
MGYFIMGTNQLFKMYQFIKLLFIILTFVFILGVWNCSVLFLSEKYPPTYYIGSLEDPKYAHHYFPAESTGTDTSRWAGRFQWVGTALFAFDEIALYPVEDSSVECFRLLFVGNNEASVVQVKRLGDDIIASKKILIHDNDNDSLYKPFRTSKLLSGRDWNKLQENIIESDFWNLPSNIERGGLDGFIVLIEGITKGKYQMVYRWAPEGPLLKLCTSITELCD